MKKENIRLGFYTKDDCIPTTGYVNYSNKVLVVNRDYLDIEYRIPAFQIYFCSFEGDYGYDKDTRLIGFYPADNKQGGSIHRSDIIGILKPELVEELGLSTNNP